MIYNLKLQVCDLYEITPVTACGHGRYLVPVAGLEPARYRYQRILSPSRLPIPPHRRTVILYHKTFQKSIVKKNFFDFP